jgi:hypothetical protein
MTAVPLLQKLSGQARRQFADPTRQWVSAIGLAIAVGIAYFLAARLSLSLLQNLMVLQFSGPPPVLPRAPS